MDGRTAFFSARGDLFAVALDGMATNLTRTPAAVEDHPALSPDGRTLAFIDDTDGEQPVATMPAVGNHGLWLGDVTSDHCERVAHDPEREIRDARFSPGRRWLAYSTQRSTGLRAIRLRDLASGRDTIVSSVMEDDHDPVFSGDGRFLFFRVLDILRRRHAGSFINREGAVSTLPGAIAPQAMGVPTDICPGVGVPRLYRGSPVGRHPVLAGRDQGSVRA